MIYEFCRDRFGIVLNRFDRLEYKNGELVVYRSTRKDRVSHRKKDIVELLDLMEKDFVSGIDIFYHEEARWDDDDYIYFSATTLKDHFEIYSD